MDTEIELKYLVLNEDVTSQISSLLTENQFNFTHTTKQLANHYFDTPDLSLRKLDMGLRVREIQGKFEQTIKTAGKAVGGLHQRPEYNYPIEQNLPILSMFPADIWGANTYYEEIQDQLLAIFTTNFTRNIWLIQNENGSEIELVFDKGEICADGQVVPIHEIEIELFKGSTLDLFSLAEALFERLKIRPGIKSKAARGYALWQKLPVDVAEIPLLNIHQPSGILSNFYEGLSFHLHTLQKMVDNYLESPSLTLLGKLTDVLALLRHGFWIYSDYLPESSKAIRDELTYYIQLLSWVDSAEYLQELTNKTGNYRHKLDLCQELISQIKIEKREFPSSEQVSALIHTTRFNRLQLSILKLLLAPEPATKPEPSIEIFAKEYLNEQLKGLNDAMNAPSMKTQEYLASRKALHRSLLSGNWLGYIFQNEERDSYRAAWLDLQEGISELQALWFIQKQLKKLAEPSEKLNKWQDRKVENLLLTLDQTREHALSLPPYWEQ